MAMDLFSSNKPIPLANPIRFDFEDTENLKNTWNRNVTLNNSHNLVLLLSDHVATFGYWLQPSNCPFGDFDIVFKGSEINKFFQRLNTELLANKPTKRAFVIDYGTVSAAIVTTNGLVTSYAPIFKWMFGKTLAEIKPWIVKQPNYKVQELTITEVEKHNVKAER